MLKKDLMQKQWGRQEGTRGGAPLNGLSAHFSMILLVNYFKFSKLFQVKTIVGSNYRNIVRIFKS